MGEKWGAPQICRSYRSTQQVSGPSRPAAGSELLDQVSSPGPCTSFSPSSGGRCPHLPLHLLPTLTDQMSPSHTHR